MISQLTVTLTNTTLRAEFSDSAPVASYSIRLYDLSTLLVNTTELVTALPGGRLTFTLDLTGVPITERSSIQVFRPGSSLEVFTSNGTYVRHRPRMVRESIFQDLRDTLIRTDWLAGTTRDGLVTTTPSSTFPLLEGKPINLIDFFPEGVSETPPNTFAVDIGEPGDLVEGELGGYFEQPYGFEFAFYASSDAVAIALFSDLTDRYMGLSDSPFISLYNYLTDPPNLVVRMEVENFKYARNQHTAAPNEVHLYSAQLEITDYVDQARTA